MLAFPSLVDAHTHPDKTGFGQQSMSRAADHLSALIEHEVSQPAEMASVEECAGQLLRRRLELGVRAVRVHADVAPVYGTANVGGVLAAAAPLADRLDMQVVAFPQHGVTNVVNCIGRDVRTVVINGRTVVDDHRVVGVDQEGLRQRGQSLFQHMRAAYTNRDFRSQPESELFPPSLRRVVVPSPSEP
jgi:cytosine/adenosine deaminase-related metal-dependent hydrolase